MSLRGWRCQSDFTYCSWSTYNNYRTNNYNTKYNTKYTTNLKDPSATLPDMRMLECRTGSLAVKATG